MEQLTVEATRSSPNVRFDPETGILEIGGESYPENSHEFFSPLIEWIDEFLRERNTKAVFRVTLTYMNTSSTKYIMDILDRLEAAHEAGQDAAVEWYCDEENERTSDTVEELREDFSMPFAVLPEGHRSQGPAERG